MAIAFCYWLLLFTACAEFTALPIIYNEDSTLKLLINRLSNMTAFSVL